MYLFTCNREMQPYFFWGGGGGGLFVVGGGFRVRARALNLSVPLGSGQTISGTGRVQASV